MVESLFAVTINWNSQQDTAACVASLFRAGVLPGRVIVVDNGSSDGSAELFKKVFGSSIALIQNLQNRGFAAAVNQGIEQALRLGAEWVFLVNNDTWVSPDILREFEKAWSSNVQLRILAPLILYGSDPNRIWSAGDRLIPHTLLTFRLNADKIYHQTLPSLIPVDFVTGCGMLIKKNVFDKIGLFDPVFFMYAEDAEYCWRARLAGIKIACATRAHMWHKISVSAGRNIPSTLYLRTRNQITFYRRYARGLQVPLMVLFTLVRVITLMLLNIRQKELQSIRPLARGWRDGWLRPQPTFQHE